MRQESPSEATLTEDGRKIALAGRCIKFLSGKAKGYLLCYQLILPERKNYARCMTLLYPLPEVGGCALHQSNKIFAPYFIYLTV